jgi:putative oxidoreductase
MKLDRLRPHLLSLLRIVSAFTFALHGASLEFGVFGGVDQHGTAASAFTFLWFAGILEFWGGLALGLGLFTRPVAFVLSGQMAVAYFTAHAPNGFWPILNGGELAVLYCFLFLHFCVAGGGSFSLDAVIAARGRRAI